MKRIDTIEEFRAALATHEPVYVQSKARGQVLVPCASTLLVKAELVIANTYNPNHVSEDKMRLLEQSILDNGFCFPVVTIYDPEQERFVIIDGFHRRSISGSDWLDLDYVPVVVLEHDISKRMAATVQFNKARGVHAVDLDAEVIRALVEQGLSSEDIATRLGMDIEAVHRYKQLTGVASLFANSEYSRSWDMVED
jgi:ParB-like chromosome segregation protein Spo0J